MDINVEDIDLSVSAPHLLTKDAKTVDAKSIAFEIWKNRKDPDFVSKFVDILSKFIDEKRVFDDVEFYLPQLAHMVIHLDVDWNNKALERFSILISEASLNTALQLSFILTAAMEDFQPENKHGERNPNANPTLFFRCARLLQNVERAVVFGTPELTSEEEEELGQKHSTSMNFKDEDFSARFNHITHDNIIKLVNKIVDTGASHEDRDIQKPAKSDVLLYKRIERKGIFYRKPWKSRYVTIDQRVLIIYRDEYAPLPLRALPLQGCILITREDAKYPYYLEISNPSTQTKFLLRASSQATYDKWITLIKHEINDAPEDVLNADHHTSMHVDTTTASDDSAAVHSAANILSANSSAMRSREASMSSYQLKRFKYFEQQRSFITALTDISESLRFRERDVRKYFLKKEMTDLVIPPFVYLPLCSSSDRYRYILRSVPGDCHAFNTKARCPALMFFEVEEHLNDKIDYMTFLSQDIWEYPEADLIEKRKICIAVHDTAAITSTAIEPESPSTSIANLPSKLSIQRHGYVAWREEGTGLRRMSVSSQAPQYDPSKVPTSLSISTTISHTIQSPPSPLNQLLAVTTRKIFIDSDTFAVKASKVRAKSPYRHLTNWKLDGLIAKSNDDVRQEVFVMQMITSFKRIFELHQVPVYIHTYRILSTSRTTGLIELIKDSISLDGLKKKDAYPGSLRKYYEVTYGYSIAAEEPPSFKEAIMNFVRSMAGYSIVCYLLAIKDRHNGNVMVDADGHIIHIDFGFVFGLAPGKAFSMEKAPFKLNEELTDVMGGRDSSYFAEFRDLCIQSYRAARKNSEELVTMMEIMFFQSNYPAFKYNKNAIRDFVARLHLDKSDDEVPGLVDGFINKSFKHPGTDFYDSFQLLTNGIAK